MVKRYMFDDFVLLMFFFIIFFFTEDDVQFLYNRCLLYVEQLKYTDPTSLNLHIILLLLLHNIQ